MIASRVNLLGMTYCFAQETEWGADLASGTEQSNLDHF